MGESACLMQPFSYAAGIPSDAPEANPLQALGQSISFGRFMSEKLDWEKWSTFSSQNPYVAEAERYSRPGSVAQKKAFFEAHYKKLAAARKAAAEALLEQENKPTPENALQPEPKPEPKKSVDQEGVEGESKDGFGSKLDLERKVLVENPIKVDSKNYLESMDYGDGDGNDNNQQIVARNFQKENPTKIVIKINGVNKRDKNSTAKKQKEKPSLNYCEEDSKLTSNTKTVASTSILSCGKAMKSSNVSAKPVALVHSKKEKSTTPISRKPKLTSSEKTRVTPKSSYKSYSFTPAKEFNRFASIIRKIDGSRAGSSGFKTSKNCKTPLRTPNMVSANEVGKNPLCTPLSDNRRGNIATGSSAKASKTTRAKWNFLPTEKTLYSPSCFTPFGLRTEERAERRKKKLEEKFKATEAQKLQQTAVKENAEKEEKSKLQQRLCFKARPLPSFYRQRPTPTDQSKKALLQHQESPVMSKNISTMQDKTYSNISKRL